MTKLRSGLRPQDTYPTDFYPVTDPALDAPDGATLKFPNGYEYERQGDEWVLMNPPQPVRRRLVGVEMFEGFPIEWAPNARATTAHAFVRGPGSGDRSICGRATYIGNNGYEMPHCGHCAHEIELVWR